MADSAAAPPGGAPGAGAAPGLFVSLISKLSSSSSVSHSRWTPHFTRLVDRLTATARPDQQVAQLQQFEDTYLSSATNNNKFDNSGFFAQTDLLHLWECALACALQPKLPTAKRQVALRVVLKVMERDDFSLNAAVSADNCLESKRRYNKLLVGTFELATLILKSSSTADEVAFAAQALAVFLFRLPYCSTMLVNALAHKELAEEKRAAGGGNSRSSTATAAAVPAAAAAYSPLFGPPRQHPRRRGEQPQQGRPPSFSAFTWPPPASSKTDVDSSELDRQFVRHQPDLFLWNSTFTDPAMTGAVVELITEYTPVWSKYLQNKEAFFLRFVEHLVEHVQRVVRTTTTHGDAAASVRWQCVPAYGMILTSLFGLLRSAVWWDSVLKRTPGQGMGWVTSMAGYLKVKKTAVAVLRANPALLPSYCQLAFECTNLHSLLSVDSCIEHLQLFLTCSSSNTSSLASSTRMRKACPTKLSPHFDYAGFWQNFSLVLQSESYQVLLKSCSFLYNVMDLFVGQNRARLVSDLLQPAVFWRLFLHWSGEVRTCFHHLVVYKVLRCDRRFLPCFSDSQVMLLYGVNSTGAGARRRGTGRGISQVRVETSAKAAWGKLLLQASPDLTAGAATKDEIAQLTKSAQRRMAIFDSNADDEELWFDMSVSSKIDSYVRMCLQSREETEEDGASQGGVPRQQMAYVDSALEQYSLLLIRYYRGATLASLDDIPTALTHRMVLTEFSEGSGGGGGGGGRGG